jgi:hypothetical protein
MGFVPFPNGVRADMVYQLEGSVVVNSLHYAMDEDPDETAMLDLADAIIDTWVTYLRQSFTNGITLQFVRVTDLHAEYAPSVERPVTSNGSGEGTGDSVPANCALQLGLKTAYRGRSYRGRVFLAGLQETNVTRSAWQPSLITQIQTLWLHMLSHETAVGPAVLCVASRIQGGVERTTGVLTPVLTLIASPYVCSQKRRLPGRGV